ncbi:MAG: methyl-accepting chemotaxis protein [Ruminococcus sp.]|nr:methyl-accepting chemotaxis protein [Ruminococcus sp.]
MLKMSKRILSAGMAFAVVLMPPADGGAFGSVTAGAVETAAAVNTAAARAGEVVSIGSRDEFIGFAEECVLDSYSKGKTFSLECDIILNGEITVPCFTGTFEGNGHTISGLRIEGDGSEKGLFRIIESTGVVKNLKVSGSIAPGGSGEDCGGIAGVNRGRIIGCEFSGLVSGKNRCGGITGVNEESGFIADCSVSGAVRGKTASGGICGENGGIVICCVNEAAVNTVITDEAVALENIVPENLYSDGGLSDITDCGGIAGYSTGALQNCVNRGQVGYPHVGYNMGGIAGRQNGYIAGCSNYGEINGRKDVGGIAGQAEPYLSLFYNERTADKLRTALDELNVIIDEMAENMRANSDMLTGNTEDILSSLENIHAGADNYKEQADRIINANVDSLNELSSRIADITDMAKPVSDNLEEASDSLRGAFDDLSECAEYLAQAGDSVDDSLDYIHDGLTQLSEAFSSVSEASKALSGGLDGLEKALGDEASMRAALKALREDVKTLRGDISTASSAVSDLFKAMADYSGSGAAANTAANVRNDLSAAANAADRAAESLNRCESSFNAIEDLMRNNVYDMSSYSPYIEEIFRNVSDGGISDMFESLGRVTSDLSELFGGEAYNNLSSQARQSLYDMANGLQNANTAGEDIGDNIDRIANNGDIDFMGDFWDGLKNARIAAEDIPDPLKAAIDYILDSGEFIDDADRALTEAALCAESASDKASAASDSAKKAFEGMGDIIDYLSAKDKITFTGADDEIISAGDELSGLMSELGGLCEELADSAGGTAETLADDITRLNDKAGEVSGLLFDLIDEIADSSADPADYTEDISAEDTAGRSDGKIASCNNYGNINGDVSVGGIAGAMAVEVGFDPEGDIETIGERSPDFMYMSKTVVRECGNYGKVTSKKDNAGGIAGEMDTGCLINCGGFGDVKSESGSFAGGVAGKSEAKIYGCSAKCRVTAAKNAGGIAGQGRDIDSCRSFAIIKGANEQAGFIAGNADGDITGCRFIGRAYEPVTESLEEEEDMEGIAVIGGIDNVSYGGRAYEVSYEEMMREEGVPEEFGKMTFVFRDGEDIIGTVNVPYEGELKESMLPGLPEREGEFVRWQEFDGKAVTFGGEIYAVYSDYVTSLASGAVRENGLAAVIIEGKFAEGDAIGAENEGEKWNVDVPAAADGVETGEHTVRFLPLGNAKRTEIILRDETGERTAETDIDGQYLVFTAKGNGFEFEEREKPSAAPLYWGIGGIAAAAAVAAVVVKRKSKAAVNS